jgi:indolepyruvate ferredoxin oxidoreductase
VQKIATPPEAKPDSQRLSETLEEMIARRVEYLTQYQDAAYAARYRDLVTRVQAKETPGQRTLTAAVARYGFKLMAYKDEYEVARLYTQTDFRQRIAEQFEGDYKLTFHLAPPVMSAIDPSTGQPKKRTFGPWMMSAFALLARFKFLRGGALDAFGYTAERKMERQLIEDYFKTIDALLPKLNADNYQTAVDIASIPDQIRGFGHVKHANVEDAKKREAELRSKLASPVAGPREIRIKAAA